MAAHRVIGFEHSPFDLLNAPVQKTCTDCGLHRAALTNCMRGKGPENAQILVVGEGPGGEEDMQGVPFVGRSGKLLDAMLRDASLAPEELRFTNAVRCRPPANRDPDTSEIDACRRHLHDEIHAVRPAAIVAIGAVALHALTRKSGIASWRGKSLPLHEEFGYPCDVWPTYHSLRQPQARNVVVADLRRIRDRGLEQTHIAWEWCAVNPNGLITSNASPETPLAFDIETIDADGKIVNYPTQIAFTCELDRASVSLTMPKNIYGWPTVTHNGWAFDLPKLGMEPQGRDTLVLAYLDDETQPRGLEALCVKYLGVRGWKEDREGAPLGSEALAEYNARDAVYTLRLYHRLLEVLGDRVKIADRIILPGLRGLLACSARGIYIDGAEVARVKPEIAQQVESTKERLQEFVGAVGYTKKGLPIEFNPNSRRQVGEVLARWFSLGRTKAGQLKTDKATIESCLEAAEYEEHPNAIPFLRDFKAYTEAKKTLSTYITPYEQAAASEDGRMHNEYTAYNTVTGRTSARRSNVQNLDRRYKAFLSAPPGAVAVEADYAGIEFRIGGWYAQEPTIMQNYQRNPNWDPHTFMASLFYGLPEAEILAEHKAMIAAGNPNTKRQIMKSANFALCYIGVEQTLIEYALQFGIVLSWGEAKRIVAAWRSTFNGFVRYWNATWEEVLASGYAESATGRRRHFGDVKLLRGPQREAARREAVNFKIQSLATADIGLLALAACNQESLPINYFGHDAIRFEFASAQDYEERKHLIRPAMIDRPLQILREEFNCDITIPLEIETKVWQK